MASELSKFIEDELKKQGIHDDEEQKLLAGLRVKPLSVQAGGSLESGAPGGGGGGRRLSSWSSKQKLLAATGIAVLFVGLVLLVAAYRQPNPYLTGASEQRRCACTSAVRPAACAAVLLACTLTLPNVAPLPPSLLLHQWWTLMLVPRSCLGRSTTRPPPMRRPQGCQPASRARASSSRSRPRRPPHLTSLKSRVSPAGACVRRVTSAALVGCWDPVAVDGNADSHLGCDLVFV